MQTIGPLGSSNTCTKSVMLSYEHIKALHLIVAYHKIKTLCSHVNGFEQVKCHAGK